MKREIKDFTPKQLNAFANIKQITSDFSFEELDEIVDYLNSNVFDFSNKK